MSTIDEVHWGGKDRISNLEDAVTAIQNGGSVSAIFNVKLGYGAVGDGTTDDTAAIQAAIDAASAAGGGIVYFPGGTYKVTSLDAAVEIVLVGAGRRASILSGTAGSDIIVLPTDGHNNVFRIAALGLSGGRRGIVYTVDATSGYWADVSLSNVEITDPSAECIYTEGQIEEWFFDRVLLTGGTYGFRHASIDGSSANLIDKCTFKDVTTNGQSEQGWRLEAKTGNTNTWINPILQDADKDGFYADGGFRSLVFINPNTEANGLSGKNQRTTGSITSGTASLTVASATGYSEGDPITIAGAGAGGLDLTTTISTISGTTFTLAANASTTVTSADVTNASYDDFRFNNVVGSAARVEFIGGIVGQEASTGKLRYAVSLAGVTDALLVGVSSSTSIPVYDPKNTATVLGGNLEYRFSATITSDAARGHLLFGGNTAKLPRGQVVSPNGKPFYVWLRDSNGDGTGTFGGFEVHRFDSNRTRVLLVPGKGPVVARDSFQIKTKAGAPADTDFDATPADGTLVADTTNSKLYVRIGGSWKSVAVA